MWKKLILVIVGGVAGLLALGTVTPVDAGDNNFGWILEETTNTNREINFFDRLQKYTFDADAEGIRDFVAYIAIKIIIPVMTRFGIFVAIIGFYKLMTNSTEEDLSKAKDYILRGLIGVVVMVSAGYMADQLVGDTGEGGIIGGIVDGNSGARVAEQIYVDIFFPIMKIFIFLVLGILFILVLGHGLRYIFTTSEKIQEKSLVVLLYNATGIFVIILAKTMVEAVYGPYQEVAQQNVEDLGDVGGGIFNDPATQFSASGGLYAVLNWLLGITMFLIVILLIYQGYQLLVHPTNEETIKKLKRNIIYIFVGIAVIGAGYLISNFFLTNSVG